MTPRAVHATDRRPRGRTVPRLALVLVTFAFVACLPVAAGAAASDASPEAPGTTAPREPGVAETSVGTVDQSPIVSVVARRDTNGMTVPLMLLGTAAMLVMGFGMLAVRCVRNAPGGS